MKKIFAVAMMSLMAFALLGCQQKPAKVEDGVTETSTATVTITDGKTETSTASVEIEESQEGMTQDSEMTSETSETEA